MVGLLVGVVVVNHREGSQRPEVGRLFVVKVGQAQQSVGASESFSVKKNEGGGRAADYIQRRSGKNLLAGSVSADGW